MKKRLFPGAKYHVLIAKNALSTSRGTDRHGTALPSARCDDGLIKLSNKKTNDGFQSDGSVCNEWWWQRQLQHVQTLLTFTCSCEILSSTTNMLCKPANPPLHPPLWDMRSKNIRSPLTACTLEISLKYNHQSFTGEEGLEDSTWFNDMWRGTLHVSLSR